MYLIVVQKMTAMMLPEHVKLLKDWENETEKTDKPELDEQRWEEINEMIQVVGIKERIHRINFSEIVNYVKKFMEEIHNDSSPKTIYRKAKKIII